VAKNPKNNIGACLKIKKELQKKNLHVEIQKILHEFYNIKDFSLYFKKILKTYF